MSLLEKVKEMLGFGQSKAAKLKTSYIGPDISRAIQRNEQASANAQRELEELKRDNMAATLKEIAGKM